MAGRADFLVDLEAALQLRAIERADGTREGPLLAGGLTRPSAASADGAVSAIERPAARPVESQTKR
jgi:hypothetical protein